MKYDSILDFYRDVKKNIPCDDCPYGDDCPDKTQNGYCTFAEYMGKKETKEGIMI